MRKMCYCRLSTWVIFLLLLFIAASLAAKRDEKKDDTSEKWKKKDIRDYSDADMERLFEQWEVMLFLLTLSPLFTGHWTLNLAGLRISLPDIITNSNLSCLMYLMFRSFYLFTSEFDIAFFVFVVSPVTFFF